VLLSFLKNLFILILIKPSLDSWILSLESWSWFLKAWSLNLYSWFLKSTFLLNLEVFFNFPLESWTSWTHSLIDLWAFCHHLCHHICYHQNIFESILIHHEALLLQLWHWSSEENNLDDRGDEREEGISAGGSLVVPWRRWPAAAVDLKEKWKWRRLGFVGRDLVKKWVRYGVLKIREIEAPSLEVLRMRLLRKCGIYRRGWSVINYSTM